MEYDFTWEEFGKACVHLSQALEPITRTCLVKYIYGVPRGGLVLAVSLSHCLNIPITLNYDRHLASEVLVVDDISDSGKTLSLLNPIMSATIHVVKDTVFMPTVHYAEKDKNNWIIYPWEMKWKLYTT